MIQDIAPLQLNNSYEPRQPEADSCIMGFSRRMIYLRDQEELSFLTYRELADACREREEILPRLVYLFSIGGQSYFLTDCHGLDIPGFTEKRLFEVRAMKPREQVLAASTAWHLYVWYRDNQFCGRCGSRLRHGEGERMLVCPDCGNQVFPKIAPAVIVGVVNGKRILMTRYAGREYKRYALIAGFTEIGETPEETVRREVMEEVGLRVKNIRYYKSQPWGFDSNLLLGYYCELDGEDEIHMDQEELSAAEWVDYRDIPDNVEGLSLTAEMMEYFRDQQMAGEKGVVKI